MAKCGACNRDIDCLKLVTAGELEQRVTVGQSLGHEALIFTDVRFTRTESDERYECLYCGAILCCGRDAAKDLLKNGIKPWGRLEGYLRVLRSCKVVNVGEDAACETCTLRRPFQEELQNPTICAVLMGLDHG